MPTAVGIVERDHLLRGCLAKLLDGQEEIHCLATCASELEALQQFSLLKPDVILVGVHWPHMSGIECVRKLNELLPTTPLIALIIFNDCETILSALQAGAWGCLLLRSEPDAIIDAVKQARAHCAFMNSQVAGQILYATRNRLSRDPGLVLTEQEVGILSLFSRELSEAEIAREMNIRVCDLGAALRSMYAKLRARR